jgi:pimeloyl-ACP methyl ester carboxylesterase
LTIRGWFIPGQGTQPPRPAALVVHGWGGSAIDMQPVAHPLLAAGLDVLLLDARCHGRSDDDDFTSMPAFAEDVQTALRWLRGQPDVDPARVVLVGHSVGAGACLLVAARDEAVAAVVCLASMADPRTFMARTLRRQLPRPLITMALRFIERTIGHRFEEFAPMRTIGRVRGPVLLLHGALDTTVPVSDAYRLRVRAPAGSSLIVLPDADHLSVEALDRVAADIRRFLLTAGVLTTPNHPR